MVAPHQAQNGRPQVGSCWARSHTCKWAWDNNEIFRSSIIRFFPSLRGRTAEADRVSGKTSFRVLTSLEKPRSALDKPPTPSPVPTHHILCPHAFPIIFLFFSLFIIEGRIRAESKRNSQIVSAFWLVAQRWSLCLAGCARWYQCTLCVCVCVCALTRVCVSLSCHVQEKPDNSSSLETSNWRRNRLCATQLQRQWLKRRKYFNNWLFIR